MSPIHKSWNRQCLSNVGELLKRKAEQGVKVVLLVWNEKLSTDRTDGVMATHDNETENFFEGTEVSIKMLIHAIQWLNDQSMNMNKGPGGAGHKAEGRGPRGRPIRQLLLLPPSKGKEKFICLVIHV